MPLTELHPLVRDWFLSRFDAPTEAQTQGWPAIARGRHTLIAAPTGSGKTLAAFLMCIDGLVRRALTGDLPDSTQIVYVSPLKALSNDISKNLEVRLSARYKRLPRSGDCFCLRFALPCAPATRRRPSGRRWRSGRPTS